MKIIAKVKRSTGEHDRTTEVENGDVVLTRFGFVGFVSDDVANAEDVVVVVVDSAVVDWIPSMDAESHLVPGERGTTTAATTTNHQRGVDDVDVGRVQVLGCGAGGRRHDVVVADEDAAAAAEDAADVGLRLAVQEEGQPRPTACPSSQSGHRAKKNFFKSGLL